MGLLPVLIVQQGQDSPLGQGKESAPSGGDLYQTLGAVQKPHHRLPLKEMHPSDFLSHILVSWCFATGCFVHVSYGITRGLTLSLNQAVKVDEALLAGSGGGYGSPALGEEDFFHLSGYPVGLETRTRHEEVKGGVGQFFVSPVEAVGVEEGEDHVDGHVQGPCSANQCGTARRVGYGEVLKDGLEGAFVDPSDGVFHQARRSHPVEQGGSAGYTAAGVVGGSDPE